MQTTVSTLSGVDLERPGKNIETITAQAAPANFRLVKKKMSIVVVLMITLFSTAFSQKPQPDVVKKIRLDAFSKINIKEGLTVILIEDENEDSVRIEGTAQFVKKIVLRQNGNELEIIANSFKNLKKEGAIYIPVRSFIQIEINADANLVSASTLKLQMLDILVNGDCTVNLATNGKVNISETEGFSFVHLQRQTGNKASFIK